MQNAIEIIPNLFLGNESACRNAKRKDIAVVHATVACYEIIKKLDFFDYAKYQETIAKVTLEPIVDIVENEKGIYIPIHDSNDSCSIKRFAQIEKAVNAFIDKHIKIRPVLVHCAAGISRSATLVALYLVHCNKIKAAIEFKKIYPCWSPNNALISYCNISKAALFKLYNLSEERKILKQIQ